MSFVAKFVLKGNMKSFDLKSFLKAKKTSIDNLVFRLHYQWTVLFLLLFTLVLTVREHFGEPIECQASKSDKTILTEKMIVNFCWTSGTFSVATAFNKEVGTEVAYPGVDRTPKDRPDDIVRHSYYQWVNYVLFLQSGIFYLPHLIWKSLEAGRMLQLSLSMGDVTLTDDERSKRIKALVQYLERNRGKHLGYFWSYFLTECLNFVVVLSQMLILDIFLGGKFISYGLDVIGHPDWGDGAILTLNNPMLERFPRMTKCVFHACGPSGTIQKMDTICHLSLNIINEKIFLFLWFWFCTLLTLSSAVIIYRVIFLVAPCARLLVIRVLAVHSEMEYLRIFVDRSNIGDWFLMSTLTQNIDALNFRDVLSEYVKTALDPNANLQ